MACYACGRLFNEEVTDLCPWCGTRQEWKKDTDKEKKMEDDFNREDEFTVDGPTDLPSSNTLDKGRYPFEVLEAKQHTSKSGNKCALITIKADWKKMDVYLRLTGDMSHRWRQFFQFLESLGRIASISF